MKKLLLPLALCLMLLAGCAAPVAAPAPTAEPTASPQPSLSAPTASPSPSPAPTKVPLPEGAAIEGAVLVCSAADQLELIEQAAYTDGTYTELLSLDGMLFVTFERTLPIVLEKETLEDLYREAYPDAVNLTVEVHEELTQKLQRPVFRITFISGQNEETRHCEDIYFQNDFYGYSFRCRVPVDFYEDYIDQIAFYQSGLDLFTAE